MIDQAQSLNVFVPADSDKKYIHDIHYSAWKKGVKSLYYCRSQSIQRAETGSSDDVKNKEDIQLPDEDKKIENSSHFMYIGRILHYTHCVNSLQVRRIL